MELGGYSYVQKGWSLLFLTNAVSIKRRRAAACLVDGTRKFDAAHVVFHVHLRAGSGRRVDAAGPAQGFRGRSRNIGREAAGAEGWNLGVGSSRRHHRATGRRFGLSRWTRELRMRKTAMVSRANEKCAEGTGPVHVWSEALGVRRGAALYLGCVVGC